MTHILNREKKIADDLIISELLTRDHGRAGWGWLVLTPSRSQYHAGLRTDDLALPPTTDLAKCFT